MTKRQILLVMDELPMCHSIREHMRKVDADVFCVSTLAEALDSFMEHEYCLVITDLQLSGLDGLKLLHAMRGTRHMPILVITLPLTADEKVALFQAGANAYIEKPVDMAVCAAQSMTLIELFEDSDGQAKKYDPLIFGTELIICPLYRQVIVDGTPLDLTRREFDLLLCLAHHPGQVWSRNQLYQYIWEDTLGLDGDHTVKTHIGNLKKKLANMGKKYIQNSRGIGYKFIPPEHGENHI